MKQKPTVPVDRVKNRLEQLDQDDEEEETLQLSQKDYIKHIEKKREALIEAWDTDKRVKALKIAIKVYHSSYYSSTASSRAIII
jgi:hypothetical protein